MENSIRHAGIISTLLLGGSAAFAACYDFYNNPQHTPICLPGATCGYGCEDNSTVIYGAFCELPVSIGSHTATCYYGYIVLDAISGCVCVPDGNGPYEFSFTSPTLACVKLCSDVTPGGGGDE